MIEREHHTFGELELADKFSSKTPGVGTRADTARVWVCWVSRTVICTEHLTRWKRDRSKAPHSVLWVKIAHEGIGESGIALAVDVFFGLAPVP